MDEHNLTTFHISKVADDVVRLSHGRFSVVESKMLLYMYDKICGGYEVDHNKLEEKHLKDFLRVTMGINDRSIRGDISKWFMKETPHFTLEHFTDMMTLFLRGTLEEKIDFTFSLLSSGFGTLTRERIKMQIHESMGIGFDLTEDENENVDFLINVSFLVFDKDKNHEISYDDFRKTVEAEPFLLSTLGRCIPEVDKVKEMLLLISTDEGIMYMTSLSEIDWNIQDDIVLQAERTETRA